MVSAQTNYFPNPRKNLTREEEFALFCRMEDSYAKIFSLLCQYREGNGSGPKYPGLELMAEEIRSRHAQKVFRNTSRKKAAYGEISELISGLEKGLKEKSGDGVEISSRFDYFFDYFYNFNYQRQAIRSSAYKLRDYLSEQAARNGKRPGRKLSGQKKVLDALRSELKSIDRIQTKIVSSDEDAIRNLARKKLGRGLSRADLCQVARLAWVVAFDQFDHHDGCRFATYAQWVAKTYLDRAIVEGGQTIPISHDDYYRRNMMELEKKRLMAEGAEFSEEELARTFGVSDDCLRLGKVVSLNEPVRREKNSEKNSGKNPVPGASLIEFVQDLNSPSPETAFEHRELSSGIDSSLQRLSPKRQAVVRMRNGLGQENGRGLTLEEIGKKFSITRERVRQLEDRSYVRLAVIFRKDHLGDYLELFG